MLVQKQIFRINNTRQCIANLNSTVAIVSFSPGLALSRPGFFQPAVILQTQWQSFCVSERSAVVVHRFWTTGTDLRSRNSGMEKADYSAWLPKNPIKLLFQNR
jgi:hypothetical protein